MSLKVEIPCCLLQYFAMDTTLHYTTARRLEEPLCIEYSPVPPEWEEEPGGLYSRLAGVKEALYSQQWWRYFNISDREAVISFTFYNHLFSKPIGLIRY